MHGGSRVLTVPPQFWKTFRFLREDLPITFDVSIDFDQHGCPMLIFKKVASPLLQKKECAVVGGSE
jgi:hypothetical protein